MLLCYIYL